MPSTSRRAWRLATAALAIVALGAFAGCGDDDDDDTGGGAVTTEEAKTTPTQLAITTSDVGPNRFRTEAPTTIKGGLVELRFTNAGKVPHEAQLIRIEGAHTAQEALKVVAPDKPVIPDWLHVPGGAAGTEPGETSTVTLNLEAGKYVMLDDANEDGPSNTSRGAMAEFEVTAGEEGDLPATTATITAATDEDAEPENTFEASGLKVGTNRLRFETKGDELHHVVMFPILPGKKIADVKKFFETMGRPSGPPPVDFESGANTAVLDGDLAQVQDIELRKAGKYALVCFLTDRDGKGKPHLSEGMLEEVDVK